MNQRHNFALTLPLTANDHVIGVEQAPVALVEYGDFECPNCKQAAPAVKLLLKHFEGRVRVAFRHFPLVEVHPHALQAAEVAEIAGAQGRFWPMHDLLFERQLHLRPAQLRACAEELGLDLTRYDAELADHVRLQRVREHQQSGFDSGVHGTPTFFVNGAITDVSFGLHALYDAVGAVLSRQD